MKTESGTPPAEVQLDESKVRALLEEQHPDLAALHLAPIDAGWDNAIYRLGEDMAVRLPRRAKAAGLIEREQEWLPQIAARLPLPVPVPLRTGVPGCGYPWRWSVVPWIGGAAVDISPVDARQAQPFAAFLRALHVPAPANAPRNPFRGVPLAQRASVVEERMERLRKATPFITAGIEQAWDAALEARIDAEPTWIHGDLHARNVLVEKGAITGVIDWGDVAVGDRATDLAAVWMVFGDAQGRDAAQRALDDVSDATWIRAKGWAVALGVMLLDSGLRDHPRHAAMGEGTLRRITER
jgi:aminoglycoside phosphotransferase (APT) family kinase protein